MAKTIFEGVDSVRRSSIQIKASEANPTKVDLGKLSSRVKVVKYDGTGNGTSVYNASTNNNSISGLITKELNKQYKKDS